jgi:hypothetical protein
VKFLLKLELVCKFFYLFYLITDYTYFFDNKSLYSDSFLFEMLDHPLHPPTGDHLASGFDAQDDESVLTGEFVLGQQFSTTTARLLLLLVRGRRGSDERGGHSERLGVAGRPGVAVRVELAFATGPGTVPDHLMRPDNVVEDVAVVETVNVLSLLTGRG